MINNVLVWKQPNISWIHPINIDNSINANNFNFDYLDTLNKLRSSNLKILELRDIADKISDGPFGSQLKVEEYKEQGFPVYRVKNIIDTQILDDDIVYIDAKKQQQLKRSEVLPGDVLITKAGRIGSAAVVPSKFGNGNITSHLVLVRLKKTINNYYLVAYLECKYGKVITGRESYKSTRPELTKNEIGNVIIPIPSPEIQKYIGDKVRKAEELREEAKRLKKEAETFLYEMIQLKPLNDFDKDMFSFVNSNYIDSERLDSEYYKTKYITLEKLLKSKKVTSFKDIIIESKYGASVPADYTMVGIPFIRGNNLTDNEINIDDIVYLNKKLKDEVKDHHVNTGDILITRSGTVGISAVVDEKCDGFSFGSFMIKLRIDMRIWNPYYIAAFLNSFWGKWQIERLQNGAVQQNINLQEIGRIIIPIISKENQDKIEELIKNYINKKRQSKQLIQEAKQDVEDLIEGNFDMSKVKANS
ncbi:restriction modification system DNA specificity domain-containing protein [Acetivibrio thermocellus ATCC 27405]|uniref:Restriction modification system DNA specificity domain-containing protein n=1 Tax=Acetivibrio thermocellus (strain ATCC 27405 / DSM 1237 / JCM 9322 / NBRC 103400 / NCIMB 10682 / NRRL B-4536 / VPI 7372) TaxID=203119 RepID=A3DEJ7_ACET2|nr:restriction endonuclease subunit S [Acetivibrio thermocellus]ABN52376.1 restriction modification system DNA specificity domain-containing protein [Acetivibrio thermocellus ATCC 27405]